MSRPLVSVVTPFHNTAAYLAQCIESVLSQSYERFEYILVDNCSTDGSGEIAELYARKDPRIRVFRRPQLLSQVENYNRALAEISAASDYCKIVQADDYIFATCLQLMVQAFEQSPSIGLVSSFYLKGNTVRGSGFPTDTSMLSGRAMARFYLKTGVFVFGSPTAVMYRSSIVRSARCFYDEALLHEDTEKCMQILEHWDFGFVPQLLSALRIHDESISSKVRSYQADALDWYIIVRRYAPSFLDVEEAADAKAKARKDYYGVLAQEALRFRDQGFWKYHREGLKSLGETLDWSYLAYQVGLTILRMIANPGTTVEHGLLRLRDRHRG